MPKSHFFAYLDRMKLITRWPLMRNLEQENVAEHSLQVATIAHGLTLIHNQLNTTTIHVGDVVCAALFHDASEVLTGDLPTPIKYFNPNIAREYKQIENFAQRRLVSLLPDEYQDDYQKLIESEGQDSEIKRIVKDADILAAYLKCSREIALGNPEFEQPKERLTAILQERMSPELDYFLKTYEPSFSLPLGDMI